MNQQAIFENLAEAIIDGDQNAAKENAQKAVNEGFDPLVVVDQGLSKGMEVVGAAIDVFESEPLGATHPHYGMDNVLVTPHLAYYTEEADNRLDRECLCSARRIFKR